MSTQALTQDTVTNVELRNTHTQTLMLVFIVLILRRISRFRDITHLFLRYTHIRCANTPTTTQTAELSPTVQVFFCFFFRVTVAVTYCKSCEHSCERQGEWREVLREALMKQKRGGQDRWRRRYASSSWVLAFGSHSRRWLMQTSHCQIVSF